MIITGNLPEAKELEMQHTHLEVKPVRNQGIELNFFYWMIKKE